MFSDLSQNELKIVKVSLCLSKLEGTMSLPLINVKWNSVIKNISCVVLQKGKPIFFCYKKFKIFPIQIIDGKLVQAINTLNAISSLQCSVHPAGCEYSFWDILVSWSDDLLCSIKLIFIDLWNVLTFSKKFTKVNQLLTPGVFNNVIQCMLCIHNTVLCILYSQINLYTSADKTN